MVDLSKMDDYEILERFFIWANGEWCRPENLEEHSREHGNSFAMIYIGVTPNITVEEIDQKVQYYVEKYKDIIKDYLVTH